MPIVNYVFEQLPNNDFVIDPTTGFISTRRALDYEVQNNYQFYVTTSEGASLANTFPNLDYRALVIIDVLVGIYYLQFLWHLSRRQRHYEFNLVF